MNEMTIRLLQDAPLVTIILISAWMIFNTKNGLLVTFLNALRNDSKEMKEKIVESRDNAALLFQKNMEHSTGIEQRISKKIEEEHKTTRAYVKSEIKKL